MRMWAKKLVRLTAAWRAACQGGSSRSSTVPGKGEQIEGRQHHREKPLAVAEIVLEFVAVIFQNVEALVLDLPARATAGDDLGDIVFRDGKAGHPRHRVFDLALGVEDLEADPVDQYRILAVAQLNRLDPAIAERLFRIAAADFLLVSAEFGSVDEVVERLVRSRLAGEDEIGAGVLHHLGDRVAGEQIVAQKHGAQRREACAMLAEPA